MKKIYTDRKGVEHTVLSRKFPYSPLYVYVDVFEWVSAELNPLVDDNTKKILSMLSVMLHNQIPHLKCENITDVWIVEEGYNR